MTMLTDAPENPLPLARPRSRRTPAGRAVGWLRANLFSSITSSIVSLLLLLVLGKALVSLVQWGYWNAIWFIPDGNTSACRAIRGLGACWAVIPEKFRFILFGTYPFSEQWRPALALLIFIVLFFLSSRPQWWRKELALLWAAALIAIGVLMWGGIFGMPYVSQDRWGGLPVTLILATFGLGSASPWGFWLRSAGAQNFPRSTHCRCSMSN
jgi:general L-amino acid transport system permease protein